MNSGYWDIHNHLLPGIDDGSCCFEETFDLLQAEYDQGIRHIIFTPHCRAGMFRVPAAEREEVYENVLRQAKGRFQGMTFALGCEYYVTSDMLRTLADDRCRMAGTDAVLLEFSHGTEYPFIRNAVRTAKQAGYLPIVAHAERYACLYENDMRVVSLRKAGALIQLNADSVLGNGGLRAKHFCRDLIRGSQADFIASDAHNMETRPVRMEKCMKKVASKYGRATMEHLFRKNQERLFAG